MSSDPVIAELLDMLVACSQTDPVASKRALFIKAYDIVRDAEQTQRRYLALKDSPELARKYRIERDNALRAKTRTMAHLTVAREETRVLYHRIASLDGALAEAQTLLRLLIHPKAPILKHISNVLRGAPSQ